MTPAEYRQFCESTYCAPEHVNRDEYLRLLLIEEVGEVASLFAKAMRDGVECCSGCSIVEYREMFIPKKSGTSIVGGRKGEFIKTWACSCKKGTHRIYGPEAVNRDRLKKELGDVLWASELHKHDWDEPHYHSRRPHDWFTNDSGYDEDTVDLLGRIGSEEEEYIDVRQLCWSCGFSPAEVAVANVAKLKDRQARGVLHGAGDER